MSTVVSIVKPRKLPIVTAGKLTPKLLVDFENGCYAYFANKQVLNKKLKVGCVMWGLQDTRVQVWYRTNHAAVDATGFNKFMADIHTNWLNASWEHKMKTLILASSQGNMPISDWVRLLESTNTVLIRTMELLTKNQIRNQIEMHVYPNTLIASKQAETHKIKEYAKFNNALKLINNTHIRSMTQM